MFREIQRVLFNKPNEIVIKMLFIAIIDQYITIKNRLFNQK